MEVREFDDCRLYAGNRVELDKAEAAATGFCHRPEPGTLVELDPQLRAAKAQPTMERYVAQAWARRVQLAREINKGSLRLSPQDSRDFGPIEGHDLGLKELLALAQDEYGEPVRLGAKAHVELIERHADLVHRCRLGLAELGDADPQELITALRQLFAVDLLLNVTGHPDRKQRDALRGIGKLAGQAQASRWRQPRLRKVIQAVAAQPRERAAEEPLSSEDVGVLAESLGARFAERAPRVQAKLDVVKDREEMLKREEKALPRRLRKALREDEQEDKDRFENTVYDYVLLRAMVKAKRADIDFEDLSERLIYQLEDRKENIANAPAALNNMGAAVGAALGVATMVAEVKTAGGVGKLLRSASSASKIAKKGLKAAEKHQVALPSSVVDSTWTFTQLQWLVFRLNSVVDSSFK